MFRELDLILPNVAYAGPMQMALDESLLGEVVRPTLRIYQWEGLAISFGYFQKIAEVRALHPDLPLVRRWTGGGIVEHGNDLTFSLMIPKGDNHASLAPALFYRELHGCLAPWLSGILSSEVSLAGEKEIRQGESCFTAPARDDLLLGHQKILGGAQRRSTGALLYQGSLQMMGDSKSKTDIYEQMACILSASVSGIKLSESLIKNAHSLVESRYGTKAWNERR